MTNKIKHIAGISSGLVAIVVLLVIYWVLTPAHSPQSAIRKEVFRRGNPLDALFLKITPTTIGDPEHGQKFVVQGYYSEETGGHDEIPLFYVKNIGQEWQVTESGVDP